MYITSYIIKRDSMLYHQETIIMDMQKLIIIGNMHQLNDYRGNINFNIDKKTARFADKLLKDSFEI